MYYIENIKQIMQLNRNANDVNGDDLFPAPNHQSNRVESLLTMAASAVVVVLELTKENPNPAAVLGGMAVFAGTAVKEISNVVRNENLEGFFIEDRVNPAINM